MGKTAKWFKTKAARIRRHALDDSFNRKYTSAVEQREVAETEEDRQRKIQEFLDRGGVIKKLDLEGKPIQ
jgi:hypothetical protein